MTLLLICALMGGDDMLRLPAPEFTGRPIEDCIKDRRSVRAYKDKDLTLQQVSNILWAAQGITQTNGGLRSVPSAGATYPLIIYAAKKDGLFRYVPDSHGIARVLGKDVRQEIAKAALGQRFVADAGLVVVITAVYSRTTMRYGERGIRYVHIEAGHAAQNIHLEAVALGLASVPVGAFKDDELVKSLGLKDEQPLYVIPVGYEEF